MAIEFKRSSREALKLRMALIGPSGSGKTWTALTIAEHLCGGPGVCTPEDVAVIDSERRSALKYARADGAKIGPGSWEFGHLSLENHSPLKYIEAIETAAKAGFKVLVIDSLSHAWVGRDGALETVDKIAKRSSSGNSFNAWRDVTPMHNQLVDAIMAAPLHVLFTLRVKMEYVVEKDERTGKNAPRKVGMAPVMRDGIEYEADIVGDMDLDNNLTITKTRCSALRGQVIRMPGKPLADTLIAWIAEGGKEPPPALPQPAAKPSTNGVPTTGIELWDRVCKQSVALAKSGKVGGGEFEAFVLDFAARAGHGDDPGAWGTDAVRLIYEAAKGFAQSK